MYNYYTHVYLFRVRFSVDIRVTVSDDENHLGCTPTTSGAEGEHLLASCSQGVGYVT